MIWIVCALTISTCGFAALFFVQTRRLRKATSEVNGLRVGLTQIWIEMRRAANLRNRATARTIMHKTHLYIAHLLRGGQPVVTPPKSDSDSAAEA